MQVSWPQQLRQVLSQQPCVLVTLISVKGSAPRAPGSKMIVTPEAIQGSIGGGNLEYEAISTARAMLCKAGTELQQLHYGLGPALNQCCGGAVILLFEVLLSEDITWLQQLADDPAGNQRALLVSAIDRKCVTKWKYQPGSTLPPDFPEHLEAEIDGELSNASLLPLVLRCGAEEFFIESIEHRSIPLLLFGAGHVAKEVVNALQHLPFRISWIDSRRDQFPATIPDNTCIKISPNPAAEVATCPAGALYLVMTHSHELDEDICYQVLQRTDAGWTGLIGSATKRARFVHRLSARGLEAKLLEKLVCPVGLAGISGKRPATIAVSIAAQLLMEQVPGDWR